MSRRPTSETREITPQEAREMLASAGYERQRKLNDFHVMELLYAIRAGAFLDVTAIVIGIVAGNEYLLDGLDTKIAALQTPQGPRT